MITGPSYIAFIANPKSGASSGKRLCRSFHTYLQTEGYEVRLQPTTSLANACDLAAAAAADENCQLITVAGGDGTVREITHGMAGCDKPLLLIPCGNENLLASELGFDEKLTTLIQTFEGGHTKPLDLCTFNGKCFTCITGIGFDGEVVHRVTQHRQGHVDYFDYADPLCSRMSGAKARRTRNKSASSVSDDTYNFAATGPVISVSVSTGGVKKVNPSPSAS